jgi:hypothetical protein
MKPVPATNISQFVSHNAIILTTVVWQDGLYAMLLTDRAGGCDVPTASVVSIGGPRK